MSGAMIPAPHAAGALAATAPALAGVPAAALFALAELAAASPPELAGVQIRPADAEGGVILTAAGPAAIAQLHIPEGEAVRPICLPARVVCRLRSRHREAEWLSVSGEADSPLLRLASLSTGAAVAVSCPEAEPLPPVALPSLEAEPGTDRGPLLLDPALLGRGLRVIEALRAGPAELRWISGHPVIGLALVPSPGAGCSGAVWLCRCVPDGG